MAINEDYNLNIKARGTAKARQQIAGLGKGLGQVTTAAKAFVGFLAVREILQFGNAILDASKKFEQYYNQLRLVTSGQEELETTFRNLQQGAKATRTSVEAYVDLFSKLRVSTEQLGYSIDDVNLVTSRLSKALTIAGADTMTATSVIRQFGQAMASGEVRGDEFRSIVEGMGGALTLMSIQTGVNIGELRKMSREGKLTADVMFEMFQNATVLDTIFQSLTPTLQQLEQQASDSFATFMKKLGEVTGITELYRDGLESLIYTLDRQAAEQGHVSTLTNDQIGAMLEAAESTTNYNDVLRELEIRLGQQLTAAQYSYVQNEDTIIQLRELIKITKERIEANKTEAETALDQIQRTRELTSEVNALMRPYQKYINLSKTYAATDFGTPLEKARKKYAETEKVLKALNEAQTKVAHGSEVHFEKFYELEEQINATKIAQQEFLKEIERLEEMEHPLYNFMQHIDEQADKMKQLEKFSIRTYDRMADAITDFVMTGKFSFKDLARSIIADLVRIAAQAAITFAIRAAAGAFGIPLPGFRAEGGPVTKNSPYIVGEKGPELFVPNQSGTVVPNDQLPEMSAVPGTGEVTVNFNLNVIDSADFDNLLITRRGTITSIINDALNRQGREALV